MIIGNKIFLDYNEYHGKVHPQTKKEYEKSIDFLSSYYRVGLIPLEQKISEKLKLNPQNVFCVNGADDGILHILLQKKLHSKKDIHFKSYFLPTYDHTLTFSDQCFFYHTQKDSADIYYVCSPNNPTGAELPLSHLIQLLAHFPKALFIIDVSYDFYAHDSYFKNFHKILEFKNAVIVFSMAKGFPMAGLRMGIVLTQNDFYKDYFKNHYNSKTVNIISRKLALTCIENIDFYTQEQKNLFKNRNALQNLLQNFLWQNFNLTPKPLNEYGGNFILFYGVPEELHKAQKWFEEKNIVIRYKSHWNFIRISTTCDKIIDEIKTRMDL